MELSQVFKALQQLLHVTQQIMKLAIKLDQTQLQTKMKLRLI
jgi:hypothetical protein